MQRGTLTKREKIRVICELRQTYDLKMLLKIAGMARSSFYYGLQLIKKPEKHRKEKERVKEIFEKNKSRYGYRRITMELKKEGRTINHKTVLKWMHEMGLYCKIRRKKYNSYQGKRGRVAPNRIKRNFKAERANEKWTTDVTEFSLLGKKVYLSAILDMYHSEIISYSISRSPNFRMVSEMLAGAFRKIKNTEGIIFHSDQGWQYQMEEYQKALREHGIIQSMSRKGNCLDNAMIENFFGLLKSELFYGEIFKSIEEFIAKLKEYLYYYNHIRIKEKLKGLSPIEYRKQSFLTT